MWKSLRVLPLVIIYGLLSQCAYPLKIENNQTSERNGFSSRLENRTFKLKFENGNIYSIKEGTLKTVYRRLSNENMWEEMNAADYVFGLSNENIWNEAGVVDYIFDKSIKSEDRRWVGNQTRNLLRRIDLDMNKEIGMADLWGLFFHPERKEILDDANKLVREINDYLMAQKD